MFRVSFQSTGNRVHVVNIRTVFSYIFIFLYLFIYLFIYSGGKEMLERGS